MHKSNDLSLQGVGRLSLVISIVMLILHGYYFCYALFLEMGWTSHLVDRLILQVGRTGLFDGLLPSKLASLVFLLLTCLANQGQAEGDHSRRQATGITIIGIVLFLGSFVILARPGTLVITAFWYLLVTCCGWSLLLFGCIRLKRLLLTPRLSQDPFKRDQAGFPQEERRITSEFSFHFGGQYRVNGRQRKSFINIVNPRRGILIMGSPGSGKTRFLIEPLLRQTMEKGYALFLYDFKYDSLSRLASRLFQEHADQNAGVTFHCINFTDVSRSCRCNVLHPSTLVHVSDALGASRTIMLAINRSWVKEEGRFFVESPINLLAAAIWYLRKYDEGQFCTLPHAIELLQTPYNKLLTVLGTELDVRTLIQPFIDAYQNKSMEMLDGQIASARIPLARLASPEAYYILTGNDLTLDLNNPAKPKILCLGGDPTRREALAPVLSLYIDQVAKLCNAPGRKPIVMLCDEFATVRAAQVLNTFATARSNNVIPILSVQDLSQLRMQYSREEADMVLNISGNLFCGQTGGETARWVSERFPKLWKDRPSVSTNSTDTSISVTPQMEDAITPATLANLSSGEFVGITADDPGRQLMLKGFHAKLVRREREGEVGELPVVREVREEEVKREMERVREEVGRLVKRVVQEVAGDDDKGRVVR